jgi:glycosyltransferase A (GT-A) superfamily protein (DUF2064 family)
VSRRADTLIVLAKEPRPGRVKTRLQPKFTAAEAAALAASSLEDTLAAVRSADLRHRVLAWDGDATGWDAGFAVVPQPTGDLNARLTAAFAAVWANNAEGPRERALLIGMDTPQVRSDDLEVDWDGADAVLGLCYDGGFWAIGLRAGHPAGIFDRIRMSTERTGSSQLARLLDLGLTVKLLSRLRDVDQPEDAEAVATAHPSLHFAHCWHSLTDARPERTI